MRIELLTPERGTTHLTLRARVHWEQIARSEDEVYYSVPNALAPDDPAAFADAMLIAGLVPAYAAGERRIHVSAPVCPWLKTEVLNALRVLQVWFPDELPGRTLPQLDVDVRQGRERYAHRQPDGAVSLFSGGVDSMHLWLQNQDDLPEGHPDRIRHLLPVFGFDLGGKRDSDAGQRAVFDRFVADAVPVAAAHGLVLQPVLTNVRHLDDRSGFWGHWFVGAALASVATLVAERCSAVLIATAGEPVCATYQPPFSTSPIVGALLAPSGLRLLYPYVAVSRQQRLVRVARDAGALQLLRVCFGNDQGLRNCGICEKCVRTSLALHLAGFDESAIFPEPFSIARLSAITIASETTALFYIELRSVAEQLGRSEIVGIINNKLAAWTQYQRWREGRTLGGRVRRWLKR